MNEPSAAAVGGRPQVEPQQQQEPAAAKPRRQPPYGVVLFNDDEHSFQYVMETLNKVFGYPAEKCFALTEQAHLQGRAIVWSGTLELAELKRDQVRSSGPDFFAAKKSSSHWACAWNRCPADRQIPLARVFTRLGGVRKTLLLCHAKANIPQESVKRFMVGWAQV